MLKIFIIFITTFMCCNFNTYGDDDFDDTDDIMDVINDNWIIWNRKVFVFNKKIETLILDPINNQYNKTTPGFKQILNN